MYKVALVGPESTGKSMLTQALARHFASDQVAEYAREYVEQLNRPYTYDDVCAIAQQQIAFEKKYATQQSTPYVYFDTDLIITKVWFDYCYGQVPDFVEKQLQTGFFDLYLLCEPDLPWEADPVREHGDDRNYFFERYRQEIERIGKPWVSINGQGEARTRNAINEIEHFFNSKQASI